ncbi:STAS domain-containing protein [Catenulispora yoronensis]|uniref:Anti-sigma factor antagonist n=1 Tax=Catenulispora yoronensis TaxID=450799 RepID=A0ABN2TI76_9ACTN
MTERTLTVLHREDPSGAVVLTVAGELDHHTAPRLATVVREAPFAADEPTIIDLTELTYCDSTGLTVLVAAYQRSKEKGGALTLAGLNTDVMQLFKIVGFDQIFTFAPTVAEAIGA